MRISRLLSLLSMLIMVLVACGGDNGESFLDMPQRISTENDLASIGYPENWVAESLPNAMRFANDQTDITAFPETLSEGQVTIRVDLIQNLVSGFDENVTLEQVLTSYSANDFPILDEFESFNEDDQPAVLVQGTLNLGTQTIGVIYAITNEDSAYALLTLLAPADQLDDYKDIVRSMIVTFDAQPPPIGQ